MKRILTLTFAVGFFFVSIAAATAAGPVYQEGQWEITTTMDMPGMPKEMNRPMVYKTCLTQKDAVPQPQEKADNSCKMVSQTVSGNTVTWKMACKDGTTSEGKITYSKASYEGTSTTTTTAEGRKMVMKSTMKGRYLGPCPKK